MNASVSTVGRVGKDIDALLGSLVAFDTTSRNSNLELIDFVAAYLRRRGVVADLTFDDGGRKANLFATLGDGTKPGLILSGHTDVVPVDGQSWNSDPFALVCRDGRFYGRGAADMKGFLAVVLSKVDDILDAGLPAPIHLALTYDEEVGCLGVRGLLSRLAERGLAARGCVVGEPTSMVPVTAHKGKRAYRCCVRGLSAHSSLRPFGVNAIEHAAGIIARLSDMADALEKAMTDDGFDVPYTTLNTTTIKGGMATNTIPADCDFSFEYRFLPQADPERIISDIRSYISGTVEPRMRRIDGATGVDLDQIISYPPLDCQANGDLLALVQRWCGRTEARKVAFGTEAGLYAQAGIPAVVCGPGDIRQAHRPDEYVETAQLLQCERFIDTMIADLAEGG